MKFHNSHGMFLSSEDIIIWNAETLWNSKVLQDLCWPTRNHPFPDYACPNWHDPYNKGNGQYVAEIGLCHLDCDETVDDGYETPGSTECYNSSTTRYLKIHWVKPSLLQRRPSVPIKQNDVPKFTNMEHACKTIQLYSDCLIRCRHIEDMRTDQNLTEKDVMDVLKGNLKVTTCLEKIRANALFNILLREMGILCRYFIYGAAEAQFKHEWSRSGMKDILKHILGFVGGPRGHAHLLFNIWAKGEPKLIKMF